MKILVRVIFVSFLIFIGLQLYSCSAQRAYNKAIVEEGNKAFANNDFTLFKEIFVYHQEEAIVDESFLLNDANTLYGVTNKDISFDLTIFLQAENNKNHFTVILSNLEIEEPNDDVKYSLKTVLKKDGGSVVLDKSTTALNRLSADNNWYIQYFEFDSQTIDQIIITYPGPSSIEPIILYDSLLEEEFASGFLSKPTNDIAKIISDGLPLADYGIVKREKDPFAGKGASVFVTMAVYIVFAGVLMYAMFFTKKSRSVTPRKPQQKPKENVNLGKIREADIKENEQQ